MTRFVTYARRTRVSGLGLVLAALLLGAGSEATASSSSPAPAKAGKPGGWSLKDSPGYYPIPDPESLSVLLGRRPNAPLVKTRFQGGVRSLDELGRAVCRALHHETSDTLIRLSVTETEFREILWPEFPQSRPATGLQWQDGWLVLNARLGSGCRGAVTDFGGRPLEFLRFERADTTVRYKNFKLHNGLTLVARNERGEEERHTWLRSVAERRGVFKIYSVRD